MDISKINKNAKISGKSVNGSLKKIVVSNNKKKISISPTYTDSMSRKCGGCSRRKSG